MVVFGVGCWFRLVVNGQKDAIFHHDRFNCTNRLEECYTKREWQTPGGGGGKTLFLKNLPFHG